jgi:hypothetical protein
MSDQNPILALQQYLSQYYEYSHASEVVCWSNGLAGSQLPSSEDVSTKAEEPPWLAAVTQ